MLSALPKKFSDGISSSFGDEGERWLASLPQIIEVISKNWSLTVEKSFPNLSYHYVAPCVCADGTEAVLKIGFPGEKETTFSEIRMLSFLKGQSTVKLLKTDETRYALLLEKLTPGENLKTVFQNDYSQAVKTAIGVMRDFWRKPPEDAEFPKLEKWFAGFKKAEKIGFAPDYLAKARRFYDELNASSDREMLLHGDFHHENILSATREPFLAIDPKGIIGDICYDMSVFLINHANWLRGEPDFQEKLNEAIRQFSEAFEIEPQNLRRWVFAFSVLSAWWTFEENSENWKNELAATEIWKV
jgi:streptomycin 6-kinase